MLRISAARSTSIETCGSGSSSISSPTR
jgi:hypothetical protein